jgi:hypothetical protein
MNMSFVLRLPRKIHACRSSSNVPHLPTCLKQLPNRYVFFLSLLAGTFKSSPTPSFFQTLLTSKRTSLHNGLHFFDINFKSVPRRMCFANLTSKLVSRHNGVDLFDIWTSKSAPRPSVWQHSASKFASRHRGLQFFISHLPRWLRTRRFNELSFRPSGATNH